MAQAVLSDTGWGHIPTVRLVVLTPLGNVQPQPGGDAQQGRQAFKRQENKFMFCLQFRITEILI